MCIVVINEGGAIVHRQTPFNSNTKNSGVKKLISITAWTGAYYKLACYTAYDASSNSHNY